MVVRFLAPAGVELAAATAYSGAQGPELASRFTQEIKRTLERIVDYPEAWPAIINKMEHESRNECYLPRNQPLDSRRSRLQT